MAVAAVDVFAAAAEECAVDVFAAAAEECTVAVVEPGWQRSSTSYLKLG